MQNKLKYNLLYLWSICIYGLKDATAFYENT